MKAKTSYIKLLRDLRDEMADGAGKYIKSLKTIHNIRMAEAVTVHLTREEELPGSVIEKDVADFFRKFGATVVEKGIGWNISR